METLQYELKSKSGKIVEVPTNCAEKAKSVIESIVQKPGTLGDIIMDHYRDMRSSETILAGTFKVPQEIQQDLRLLDEIYLRVCVYETELMRRTSEGTEEKRLSEIISGISSVLQEL